MPPADVAGTAPPPLSPEDQRHELQGLLGEYHGLLTTIAERSSDFAVLVRLAEDTELLDLLASTGNALPGISASFGQVQGELNTGTHDEGLDGAGLNGDQLDLKIRGFRYHLRRFYRAIADISDVTNSREKRLRLIRAAKHALRGVRWGNIIMGSLTKELVKFKGAEVIAEFGEVVSATLEQVIDGGEAMSANESD